MQIRKAPEKLSNTKLSTCDEIIEKLKGDGWNIEIRPLSIYKKLREHPIFQNFAYSNQALCKKLRPFYKKQPKPNDIKSKIDSLQIKISYTSSKKNKLLEYLSNALLYKAFLLDAKEQVPKGELERFNITRQQKKALDEKEKALDEKKKEIEGSRRGIEKSERNAEKYKKDAEKYKKEKEKYDKEVKSSEKRMNECKNEEEGDKLFEESEDIKRNFRVAKREQKEAEEKFTIYSEDINKFRKQFKDYSNEYNEMLKEYHNLDGYENYQKYKILPELKVLREYEKLDYKVSVHIRFARTMNALNAHTEDNFTPENIKKYGVPFQETGISDEFGRKIIKHRNLMKLERHEINRYVTVQEGGIYTTVVADIKDHVHERVKFQYEYKMESGSIKPCPIWNYIEHKDKKAYTLERRIKDSCEKFNEMIDKYVISTYANYYGVNNILTVETMQEVPTKEMLESGFQYGKNKKLYLKYVYDPEKPEKRLEISQAVDDKKYQEKEAPLHILISGGEQFETKIYNPEISDGFHYEPIHFNTRDSAWDDIVGLLYAIRENKIAVSHTTNGFHSSMWSGKRVQAAGLLAAWNGKLIAVDNMSGHYKPNWYLTYMAWKPFYDKGVFHEQAILGIGVFTDVKAVGDVVVSVSQYFKVKTFMELAKNDFEIGETVKELHCHIKEMEEVRQNKKFKVTNQKKYQDCNDVLMTPHLARYHRRWGNKKSTKLLACNFIKSLNYDWKNKIIPNAINSYKDFPGKTVILLGHVPKNAIENLFKKRTKLVQWIINNSVRKDELTEKETKAKDELMAATVNYKNILSKIMKEAKGQLKADNVNYKKILSNIMKDSELDKELNEGLNKKLNKEITEEQKYDLAKFNLIKCIYEIYYANQAYSDLVSDVLKDIQINKKTRKKVNNLNQLQKDIDNKWIALIKPILQQKTKKTIGLGYSGGGDMVEGEIYLSKEEQNKAAKKFIDEIKKSSSQNSSTGEKQEDDLGNAIDLFPKDETEARTGFLPLVDPPPRSTIQAPQQQTQIQQPQQPKKTQPGSGERFKCIECNKEVVITSYDKSRCPKCGKMGCLDPIR